MLITISREFGAGGSELAAGVAAALGWSVVDNELVEQVASRAGVAPAEVAEREERVPGFIERLARTLAVSSPQLFPPPGGTIESLTEADLVRITEGVVAEVASRGRAVLVGRAAPVLLGQLEGALHVRLVAPRAYRVERAALRLGLDPADAQRICEETDRNRARYHREYYQREWADPLHYHMVLNTGRLGLDGATDVVVARARAMGFS